MGGVVGLREGERNRDLSQECGSRLGARILQLPLRPLLEAEQWLPLTHFALVGRDGKLLESVLALYWIRLGSIGTERPV
jgi:hypothetical protein